jgi:hypothetical protein
MQLAGLALLLIAGFLAAGVALPSIRGTIGLFLLYIALLMAPLGCGLLLSDTAERQASVPVQVTLAVAAVTAVSTCRLVYLLRRTRS